MASTTPAAPSAAPLKPCVVCNGESCVVIPSLASQQHLCLLHYYTTGAHRNHHPPRSATAAADKISSKQKSASLLVENTRMDRQLPKVQELFAEAFIDLQKEIGEESARQFQSAANAEDPLGMLLGGSSSAPSTKSTRPLFRKPPRRRDASFGKKPTKQKEDDSKEGGFIRETVLPEKLRKQNESFEGYASKYKRDTKAMPQKRSAAERNVSAKKPANPYQRKHNPPQNIWNQVLDSTRNDDNGKQKKQKIRYEDMEKKLISNITSGNDASTKTCTCGSTNVEISGNVTSRNNDMMKGEVWGSKNRAEAVVERCHCLACGKRWNEE